MKPVRIPLALVLAAAFLAAAANPVVGQWACVASTPDGDQNWTFTIKEEGGKLSGTASGPPGDFPLVDPNLDGNTFRCKIVLDAVAYEIELKVKGETMEGGWKGGGESGTIKGAKKA